MNKRHSVVFVALLSWFFASDLLVETRAVAGDIFKWVDDRGDTHFVDSEEKIPAKYRQKSEHRTMEEPRDQADPGVARPAGGGREPGRDHGQASDEENARRDREWRCKNIRYARIPACHRACLNPENRQARADCDEARQNAHETRRAASKESRDRRIVEERTRCLQAAQNKAEAAMCVQRSLPPPSDKVKVIQP